MALTYKRVILSGATVLDGSDGTGGTTNPAFQQQFNSSSSWAGPISGEYNITILEATHEQGIAPTVQIFEQNGVEFELVGTGVSLNAAGDVKVTVKQSPDLRFTGKIIIS